MDGGGVIDCGFVLSETRWASLMSFMIFGLEDRGLMMLA